MKIRVKDLKRIVSETLSREISGEPTIDVAHHVQQIISTYEEKAQELLQKAYDIENALNDLDSDELLRLGAIDGELAQQLEDEKKRGI